MVKKSRGDVAEAVVYSHDRFFQQEEVREAHVACNAREDGTVCRHVPR